MAKPRMYGAFAPYTPNSKADMRYRRKTFEKRLEIAERAIPREERRREKWLEQKKKEAYNGNVD